MGSGIAKVHQHAIPQVLGDMPFVARNDLLTGGLISHYPGMIVFGVKLLRECRRPHQINEHHRQLAPLGFDCDPFGKGRGRSSHVSQWLLWPQRCRRRYGCSERHATSAAEFGGGPDLPAAAWTGTPERSAALLAELGPFFILKPTACTAHRASLLL